MNTVKRVLRHDRLRQVPDQFSWVDQAFVQRHFILFSSVSPLAEALNLEEFARA